MKLFRKMNNCKKSALPFINKALLLVASMFLWVNFTFKACAMPAPVLPEGLTPQVIEGTPATQADQSNMYLTLLYALGLEISEFPSTQGDSVFRDGLNQADVDAIIESFNELNVQDPTLGDDLRQFMNVQSLVYSQNGQVKEFELPRDLWVRLNKATNNGLNLKIQSSTSPELASFSSFVKSYLPSFSNSYISDAFALVSLGASAYIYESYNERNNHFYELIVGSGTISGNLYSFSNTTYPINGFNYYGYYGIYDPLYDRTLANSYVSTSTLNLTGYANNNLSLVSSYGAFTNKHIPVASSFISNKANENYDLINKSSSIDPQTGKITGPVTIASLSPSQLQQLQDLINNGFLTLAEAMNRLGIAPYNDSTGILIDSNIDPNAMQQSLAQATSPAPTEPHLSSALSDIDEWNPQSIVPDLPLAGVMNWVAVQMNVLMNLSQFQNIWLVISTLAVCVLLIGVARLWK